MGRVGSSSCPGRAIKSECKRVFLCGMLEGRESGIGRKSQQNEVIAEVSFEGGSRDFSNNNHSHHLLNT